MQYLIRFVVGGLFVSAFSVLGDSFRPRSFAGLFGAAPSISMAGLILIWFEQDQLAVRDQAYAMIYGSLAMILYCVACYLFLKKSNRSPLLGSGALWGVWLVSAFLLYALVLK